MATSTLKTLTARLKLENGTDADGNTKYVNLSMGDLNETYYAENTEAALTALWAIRSTLSPILSKTVGKMETVATSEIANS